eukprot:scaffold101434_cov57-Phaeocystis_antarctica.AAC.1
MWEERAARAEAARHALPAGLALTLALTLTLARILALALTLTRTRTRTRTRTLTCCPQALLRRVMETWPRCARWRRSGGRRGARWAGAARTLCTRGPSSVSEAAALSV